MITRNICVSTTARPDFAMLVSAFPIILPTSWNPPFAYIFITHQVKGHLQMTHSHVLGSLWAFNIGKILYLYAGFACLILFVFSFWSASLLLFSCCRPSGCTSSYRNRGIGPSGLWRGGPGLNAGSHSTPGESLIVPSIYAHFHHSPRSHHHMNTKT